MKIVAAYIKILRPLNLLIGAFAVIVTASILDRIGMVSNWLTALVIVVCSNGAANALNDYFDQETDKINQPNRPLVTGLLKPHNVLVFAIILFVISIVMAITLPIKATIIAIFIALPMMILYSVWFKGVPLLGNFVISLILGLTFLFAGAALYDMEAMIVLALLAFGLTMVRELVKDIADYEGDSNANIRTFPAVFGIKRAWLLAAILAIITGIGAIVPYQIGYFNIQYLILLIFGVEIPLTITVVFGMKFPSIINAKKDAQLLKFSTLIGVIAIWLGSV